MAAAQSLDLGQLADRAATALGDDVRGATVTDVDQIVGGTSSLTFSRSSPPLEPSVMHGDWRLGNMQCNGGSIDAVIDSEIWSLGDRRVDPAWFLLLTDDGHPNTIRSDTGLPLQAELITTSEDAARTPLVDRPWFAALVRYKQAAVSALIAKNTRKLQQPGVDVDRMVATIPRLLDWAADLFADDGGTA